jgi:hypothetical protein
MRGGGDAAPSQLRLRLPSRSAHAAEDTILAMARVPPGLRYLMCSCETSSIAAKWWYTIEHWVSASANLCKMGERTHDGEFKAVLCAELCKHANCMHLTRLEALCVCMHVVQLNHVGLMSMTTRCAMCGASTRKTCPLLNTKYTSLTTVAARSKLSLLQL